MELYTDAKRALAFFSLILLISAVLAACTQSPSPPALWEPATTPVVISKSPHTAPGDTTMPFGDNCGTCRLIYRRFTRFLKGCTMPSVAARNGKRVATRIKCKCVSPWNMPLKVKRVGSTVPAWDNSLLLFFHAMLLQAENHCAGPSGHVDYAMCAMHSA